MKIEEVEVEIGSIQQEHISEIMSDIWIKENTNDVEILTQIIPNLMLPTQVQILN